MIKLGNFNVVIDACVLYDSILRDLLLRLAEKELYQPIWSSMICDEVKRNLIKRPQISVEKANKLITILNETFPEAVVDEYSKLAIIQEPNINAKDLHVVSAAITSNAQVIVTCNLKHFPNNILEEYSIEAQSPDLFLINLFHLSSQKILKSINEMQRTYKNPPISKEELLSMLDKRVPDFVKLVKPHVNSNIIRIY